MNAGEWVIEHLGENTIAVSEACREMCPVDGQRCTLAKGHEGPHKCGAGEWENRKQA